MSHGNGACEVSRNHAANNSIPISRGQINRKFLLLFNASVRFRGMNDGNLVVDHLRAVSNLLNGLLMGYFSYLKLHIIEGLVCCR